MTEITDIKELAQRMKAAAVRAKAATEDYVANRMSMSVCLSECAEFNDLSDGPDNILTLVEALEKAQRYIEELREWNAGLAQESFERQQRISELEPIRAAAEKLVRCKGRYHSEQNYRALAALFGVTTPDLPPLGDEFRTVTVKLPYLPDDCDRTEAHFKYQAALTAAGIKWDEDSDDADVNDRNQPGMVVAVHIDAGDFVKFRGQVYEVEETDFDDHDVTLWFVCGEVLKCAAGCQIEVVSAPGETE